MEDQESGDDESRLADLGTSAPVKLNKVYPGKLDGLTEVASECLFKAHRLAKELNQTEITSAHFFLAMALTPFAVRRFAAGNIEAEAVWRASLLALADIDRVYSSGKGELPLSDELNRVFREATSTAESRDGQETSIDDLLGVFNGLPSESLGGRLAQGKRVTSPAEVALDAVRKLELTVNEGFGRLAALLAPPTPPPPQDPDATGSSWLSSLASRGQRRRSR